MQSYLFPVGLKNIFFLIYTNVIYNAHISILIKEKIVMKKYVITFVCTWDKLWQVLFRVNDFIQQIKLK